MKNATSLGWIAIFCGLIGLVYTTYHDVLWNSHDGWVILGWKSQLAMALCVVAIIAGGNLIAVGARRRDG